MIFIIMEANTNTENVVYVVWEQPHHPNGEEQPDMWDSHIIGVYVNELDAYKAGCVKQVYFYLEHYDEDKKENMKEWVDENPFPDAEETDVQVWKKYHEIVSSCGFANKLTGEKHYYDDYDCNTFYDEFHVTQTLIHR